MPSAKHPESTRTPSTFEDAPKSARQPWTKPELRAHSIARCTLVPTKPGPGDDGSGFS